MSSIVQTMQQKRTTKNKHSSLPISFNNNNNINNNTLHQQGPLRRRLSTISLNLQPSSISTYSSTASSWAIQRSKSLSSLGPSIKGWWAWGWAWFLTRKPAFAHDLEMNEDEKLVLGFHNRGSIMHLFFKAKSHLTKFFRFNDMSLPH